MIAEGLAFLQHAGVISGGQRAHSWVLCYGRQSCWARDIQRCSRSDIQSYFCGGEWCMFVLLFVTSSFVNKVMNNHLLISFKTIFIVYMMF